MYILGAVDKNCRQRSYNLAYNVSQANQVSGTHFTVLRGAVKQLGWLSRLIGLNPIQSGDIR